MEKKIINNNNTPIHYTADVEFTHPIRLVRGFTMKDYEKDFHSQGFYEINIVLRGEAIHYIGERRIKVRTGDTFIVPPDVLHAYDGGKGFDVYHILLSPKYLEKNGSELQLLPAFYSLFRLDPMMRENALAKLHFRLTGEEIEELLPKLEILSEKSRGTSDVDAIVANAEALIIIAWLCDAYEKHGVKDILDKNVDREFILSISYIYENHKERVTVDDLAKMSRMSRTAYIEKFKRVTGMPPARFIRKNRFETAKRLLRESSMTEAEIATEVGFADASHLIKVFLSEEGVLPSAYRER